MVVQAGIEHGLVGNGVLEQLVTGHGVALHVGELVVGQRPGFVQNVQVRLRFANVVQQTGHGGLVDFGFIKPQLLGQGHHQGADGHRVHIGVVVGGFQAGNADQGIGVAQHRVGDFLHQNGVFLHVHGAAHARFAEHGHHGIAGLGAQGAGLGNFLAQRGGLGAQQVGGRDGGRGGFNGVRGRLAIVQHVQPFAQINPYFGDGARLQLLQVFSIVQDKGAAPKGVVNPRAPQSVDIHP